MLSGVELLLELSSQDNDVPEEAEEDADKPDEEKFENTDDGSVWLGVVLRLELPLEVSECESIGLILIATVDFMLLLISVTGEFF